MAKNVYWLDRILGHDEPRTEYKIVFYACKKGEETAEHIPQTYNSEAYVLDIASHIIDEQEKAYNKGEYASTGWNFTRPYDMQVGHVYEIFRRGDDFIKIMISKEIEED